MKEKPPGDNEELNSTADTVILADDDVDEDPAPVLEEAAPQNENVLEEATLQNETVPTSTSMTMKKVEVNLARSKGKIPLFLSLFS